MKTENKFSPNWWDHSFCIEVDFVQPCPFLRSGFLYESRFTPESFAHVIDSFAHDYGFQGGEGFLGYVRNYGNLRVRPGALWNVSAKRYKGDIYDTPEIWDPFTKFPFGPLTVSR